VTGTLGSLDDRAAIFADGVAVYDCPTALEKGTTCRRSGSCDHDVYRWSDKLCRIETVNFFIHSYRGFVSLNEIACYHIDHIESVAHNYVNTEINTYHPGGFVLVLLHVAVVVARTTIIGQGKHVVHFRGF